MQLHVRLFANLREVFGTGELTVNVQHAIHPAELIDHIGKTHENAKDVLVNVMVAQNQTLAPADALLTETDEIALIPPVGGGEWFPQKVDALRLTDNPLQVAEAYQLLEDVNHGGTVIFVGTVREWTGERQTEYLQYEAYLSMAKLQMAAIQADVETQFPGVSTLQWHRVGRLGPKDIAVICGASSAHRDAAFQAARMLIERLKREVSIWKQEVYTDGQSVWQANAQSPPTVVPDGADTNDGD